MKSTRKMPIFTWLVSLALVLAMMLVINPMQPAISFAQSPPPSTDSLAPPKAADGVVKRFTVMLNGDAEQFYWDDVTFMYSTLRNDYNIPAAQIFLLNHRGTNPQGQNPDQMIDGVASMASLNATFATLQTMLDGDDELLVWVTGRGLGYLGKTSDDSYLTSRASVQPGDEQDVLERDFRLRTFFVNLDIFLFHHKMGQYRAWRVQQYFPSYSEMSYREKIVSSFDNVEFEQMGVRSDNDIYIERIVDYLLGDTNRNGFIEADAGERYDYDQDGVPPMDANGFIFDEDDWGKPDLYYDDIRQLGTQVPGGEYMIFDQGFDNHLDIDLNYAGGPPRVDGTDLYNWGYFDGLDVNEDGDMDDWVSIDEGIHLPDEILWDDDLAALLAQVAPKLTTVFLQSSFGGGFVNDLSAPNRLIMTASEEDMTAYHHIFAETFTSALHGAMRDGFPLDRDDDHNGCISMVEAFNYASMVNFTPEYPQYDDNGDKISHSASIPNGGDGKLGTKTYLEKCPPAYARITFKKDAQPDSMQNFTFYTPFGKVLLDDAAPDDGDPVQNAITFNVEALAIYNFTEATLPSWSLAAINCTPAERATVDLVNRKLTLNVLANDDITCTWVNQRRVNLQATKFNDLNGDGSYAYDEPNLAGWEMVLYSSQNQRLLGKVTESSGSTVFNNRIPGTYKLCETPKAGWSNTLPGQLEPALNKPCYNLTLLPGQNASLLFGNVYGPVVRTAEGLDPSSGAVLSDLPDINEPEGEEVTEQDASNHNVYLPVVIR